MKLRNLALAVALAAPVIVPLAGQDAKKSDDKAAKKSLDPVCGMMVDVAPDAPKSDYKGKTYYFCSLEDKKEFEKSPASYIKLDKKDTAKKQ